jgi:hypothetical protein
MESGGRLTVKSALNPILWLCLIITIPSLACIPFVPAALIWIVVTLAFLPVGATILGFFFLLIVDRDKLQSESYQLRKMELERIEEKGKPAIDAATVETVPPAVDAELLPGDTAEDK